MSDEDDPDASDSENQGSETQENFGAQFNYNTENRDTFWQFNPGAFWISPLDLQIRESLLESLSPMGVPVLINGLPIEDQKSPTGYLMSPKGSAAEVAEAGRALGNQLLQIKNPLLKLLYLAASLGVNVGIGGKFDYQRGEGSFFSNFVQYPQFRGVSNFNVGLFTRGAGLPEEVTLRITEVVALVEHVFKLGGSIYQPDQPYRLDPINTRWIHQGYQAGALLSVP
jgi:hypothetical protein